MNNENLLGKLYTYGVKGIAHQWFKSYLNDRKQQVKKGLTFPDFCFVSIRVSQGRVLGSRFLVYTNKLPELSSVVLCAVFWITLSDTSRKNPINSFNRELSKFSIWFVQNRPSLNNKKKVAISFSKQITHSVSNLKCN